MAITTLAGVASGAIPGIHFLKNGPGGAGPHRTLWATTGSPGAGAYDTTLNGVALSATSGRIPFNNPASGNTYFAGVRMSTTRSVGSGNILCDRLWHNGGIDVTSTLAQAIVSPAWPARDINGSSNGEGVFLALEISATVGAATPTITVSYTNSAGTAGRTATNLDATVSGAATGSLVRIGLQAGDLGVKSVESITLSASWISGTINLVAYRPIVSTAQYANASAGFRQFPQVEDALTGCFVRIYDDSNLYWTCISSVEAGTPGLFGVLRLAQG